MGDIAIPKEDLHINQVTHNFLNHERSYQTYDIIEAPRKRQLKDESFHGIITDSIIKPSSVTNDKILEDLWCV